MGLCRANPNTNTTTAHRQTDTHSCSKLAKFVRDKCFCVRELRRHKRHACGTSQAGGHGPSTLRLAGRPELSRRRYRNHTRRTQRYLNHATEYKCNLVLGLRQLSERLQSRFWPFLAQTVQIFRGQTVVGPRKRATTTVYVKSGASS